MSLDAAWFRRNIILLAHWGFEICAISFFLLCIEAHIAFSHFVSACLSSALCGKVSAWQLMISLWCPSSHASSARVIFIMAAGAEFTPDWQHRHRDRWGFACWGKQCMSWAAFASWFLPPTFDSSIAAATCTSAIDDHVHVVLPIMASRLRRFIWLGWDVLGYRPHPWQYRYAMHGQRSRYHQNTRCDCWFIVRKSSVSFPIPAPYATIRRCRRIPRCTAGSSNALRWISRGFNACPHSSYTHSRAPAISALSDFVNIIDSHSEERASWVYESAWFFLRAGQAAFIVAGLYYQHHEAIRHLTDTRLLHFWFLLRCLRRLDANPEISPLDCAAYSPASIH